MSDVEYFTQSLIYKQFSGFQEAKYNLWCAAVKQAPLDFLAWWRSAGAFEID